VSEYKTAVRIMITAKAHDAADGVRQMELAAYMTHCSLEPAHLMLALNLAMSMAYKHSNFIHAAGFARRLLELPDISAAKNAALATKVSAAARRRWRQPAAVTRRLQHPAHPSFALPFSSPAPSPLPAHPRRPRRCCR
jgi:coatomer subunit alpha